MHEIPIVKVNEDFICSGVKKDVGRRGGGGGGEVL